MAKVISPLYSPQARGKVGGVVYKRWRNINIVAVGGGFVGDPQWSFIQIMIDARTRWAGLTMAQRQKWDDYSAGIIQNFGWIKPKTLPGYHQYLRHYCISYLGEEVPPDDPPTTKFPNITKGVYLTIPVSGSLKVWWDGAQDGDFIDVRGRLDAAPTIKQFQYKFQYLASAAVVDGDLIIEGVGVGKACWIGVRVCRTNGQAGLYFYPEPIVMT